MLSYLRYPFLILLWVIVLMSGVLSIGRELYGIYVGQVPPRSMFWSSSWVAFVISAAILWVIEHRSVSQLKADLASARRTPAEIEISPCELRRTLRLLDGKDHGRHIFLRAKIKMTGTMHTKVTRYRMELSRAGVIEEAQFCDDLALWEITNWSQNPIPHDEMRPLPTELTSGNVVEGWIHFTTELNDRELERADVRFLADTANGTGSAQVKAGPEWWNVLPDRMIMQRKETH
jgi:hypothetical protein